MDEIYDLPYFDRLLEYARAERISVRFVRTVGGLEGNLAGYCIEENEITILMSLDRDEPHTLYVFAHELGHHRDIMGLSDDGVRSYRAASAVLECCSNMGIRTPREVTEVILHSEERAFDLGEEILSELDIRLRKADMRKWRSETMSAYRDVVRGTGWKTR